MSNATLRKVSSKPVLSAANTTPVVRAIDVGFGLVKLSLRHRGGVRFMGFPSMAIPADASAVRALGTRRRDTFDVPVNGAMYEVGRDVGLAQAGGNFGRDVTDEFYRGTIYEALTKGSKSINDIKPLVTQTEAVIVGNGQIIDAELLRSTRVGKRLVRISYLTHGEVYPMQWNFYCYRSASGWQVLDITVNNDLYAIFDEEEKAQAEEKAKAGKK